MWQGLHRVAQHVAAGLQDLGNDRGGHGAVGHANRGFDHRQGEALDAEAVLAEVAAFRLKQVAGERVRLGIAGQRGCEARLGQPVELLILPERIVGIEADGSQRPGHQPRRFSIASQMRMAISAPPKRLTSRMPVGEVTLISVR